MANGEPVVSAKSDGWMEIGQGERAMLKIDPRYVEKFKDDVVRAAKLCQETLAQKPPDTP